MCRAAYNKRKDSNTRGILLRTHGLTVARERHREDWRACFTKTGKPDPLLRHPARVGDHRPLPRPAGPRTWPLGDPPTHGRDHLDTCMSLVCAHTWRASLCVGMRSFPALEPPRRPSIVQHDRHVCMSAFLHFCMSAPLLCRLPPPTGCPQNYHNYHIAPAPPSLQK